MKGRSLRGSLRTRSFRNHLIKTTSRSRVPVCDKRRFRLGSQVTNAFRYGVGWSSQFDQI